MTDKESIRQLIENYIESINTEDVDSIPLAADVEFQGSMMPEPLVGETAVREHLRQVAPFFNMQLKQLIVEDSRAAAWVSIRGVTGQQVQGAAFFQVRDGVITHDRAFFDTHGLFTGQN